MGNCCSPTSDNEGDTEQGYHVSTEPDHSSKSQTTPRHGGRDLNRGPIKSEQAHSSYLREKLKAREGERQPLLSTTDQRVSQPKRSDGIPDPRQAAHLRGGKLQEAEQATEEMNKAAGNWAKTAAMLKKL